MAVAEIGPNKPYKTFEDALKHEPNAQVLECLIDPGHNVGRVATPRAVTGWCSVPGKHWYSAPMGQAGNMGVRATAPISDLHLQDFICEGWDGTGLRERRDEAPVANMSFSNFVVRNCNDNGALWTNKTHKYPIILTNGIFHHSRRIWPAWDVSKRNIYAERPVSCNNVVLAFGSSDEQFRAGGSFDNLMVIGNDLNIGEVAGNKDPLDGGVPISLGRVCVIYPRNGRGITIGNANPLTIAGPVSMLWPNQIEPKLMQSRAWRLIGQGGSTGGVGIKSLFIDANTYLDESWDHQVVAYETVDSDTIRRLQDRTLYWDKLPPRAPTLYFDAIKNARDARALIEKYSEFPAVDMPVPNPDDPAPVDPVPPSDTVPTPPLDYVTAEQVRTMLGGYVTVTLMNDRFVIHANATAQALQPIKNRLDAIAAAAKGGA